MLQTKVSAKASLETMPNIKAVSESGCFSFYKK
jgi:hypothetical protein